MVWSISPLARGRSRGGGRAKEAQLPERNGGIVQQGGNNTRKLSVPCCSGGVRGGEVAPELYWRSLFPSFDMRTAAPPVEAPPAVYLAEIAIVGRRTDCTTRDTNIAVSIFLYVVCVQQVYRGQQGRSLIARVLFGSFRVKFNFLWHTHTDG